MDKPEDGRVERQPPDRERVGFGIPVDGVPEHRMTEEGEMNPYLVRAAGAELRLDERRRSQALERPQQRACGAAAGPGGERRAASARPRPADAALHQLLPQEIPARQSKVEALHGVEPELAVQVLGRGVRNRQHHHPRGVAVEAVHDENAPVAPGPPLQFGRGAGEHRVLLALDRGVDEQPGGLVDDDDLVVGEQHLDRRRFGGALAPGQRGGVGDLVGRSDERAGVGHDGPVEQHVADQHLPLGPRVGGAEQGLDGPGETSRRALHAGSVTPRSRAVDTRAASG